MENIDYFEKLEQAARAPDDLFPSLLFEPMSNDYGDLYFELDYEDFDNEAVRYDPRFTREKISRMRGTAKRIDVYLEWVSLYDDYVEYLTNKYGSMDIVQEMEDNGILNEPILNINHRPVLRKGKAKRLLKNGFVPSFMVQGVEPSEIYDFVKRICDIDQPEIDGEEEPDIVWALDHKPSKEEREIFAANIERYRRAQRTQELFTGTAARGIGSGIDFVEHYYAQMEHGDFDTIFSDGSQKSESGIAGQMRTINDAEYLHEGQRLAKEEEATKPRYTFNGHRTVDHSSDNLTEFYKYLQENLGIDIMAALSGSMNKKAFRAIRTDFVNAGGHIEMTEKELKKLRKKREKLERGKDKSIRANSVLAEVLTNNKILLNGGTVRFENMQLRDDIY